MKKLSKTLAFILSAALICAALCGCASKNPEPAADSPTTEEKAAPVAFRYEADISILSEAGPYYAARACTDEGFYSVDYGVWDEALGDYVTAVFHLGHDGGVKKLEDYAPVQPPQDYLALPEFYSSHELEGFALDKNGNIFTVESLYMSWYAGPGQRQDEYASMYDAYEYHSYIRRLDKNGAELSCVRLPLDPDENIYAYELKIDELGNLVFSQQNMLLFYSPEGEERGRTELPGYVRSVLQSADGELAAVCYQQDGGELLCRISPEDMSVKSSHPIPGGMMYLCLSAEENRLYYSKGQDFYALELGSGESTRLFNWLSCGVDVNCISHIQLLPGGTVRAVCNEYVSADEGHRTELADISRIPVYAGQEKTVLSLGCIEADVELLEAVRAFNRENHGSTVELKEYRLEYDFTQAGQQQALLSRLLSGEVPDILVLDGLNHRLLAAKGLFADLNAYLDSDGGPAREDFFANVLESCQRNGQLYALADGFSVDTVMADAHIAGDEPGWNYEQYNAALASMPEGCQPFERYITSEDILRSGLARELDSYIDYGSLTADFENHSFMGLLEFSRSFPLTFDWDSYEWTDADITEYRINGGRQMLMRTSLLSIEEVYFNSIYFNGNGVYKGYPSHDGSVGSALTLHRLCAISAASPHGDEAWRFISGLVEGEGSGGSWGFPSLRERCLEEIERFSVPEYLSDEDSQPLLTEDGEQIELAKGHMGTVLGVRGFYALNDTWRERFEAALSTGTKLSFDDAELAELILESLRPYYEGRIDAATAAAQVEAQVESLLSKYK